MEHEHDSNRCIPVLMSELTITNIRKTNTIKHHIATREFAFKFLSIEVEYALDIIRFY